MEVEPVPRTHHGDPQRSRSGTWIAVWVALPLLYVLSIGPAAWVHSHSASARFQEALEILYTPLSLLVEYEIPGVAPALEWYVDLCDG